MKTDTPLTDDGPCSCGPENMELKTVEQQSKLTGAIYDTIRCSQCKTVFAARPASSCSCGQTDSQGHFAWCEENKTEWPPINAKSNQSDAKA